MSYETIDCNGQADSYIFFLTVDLFLSKLSKNSTERFVLDLRAHKLARI